MIRNFLVVMSRNLMKNRLFIVINIFGMAIAIGCCMVAYFNWEYNATFDDVHVNGSTIYRVSSLREFDGTKTLFGHAPLPLGPAIKQSTPDVTYAARMGWSYSDFKLEDDVFRADLAYVDPDFFRMFTFDFVAGSGAAISDKSNVVISDEMANRLFNSVDVVGKRLTQVIGAVTREVTIGGVFRVPVSNSSFDRSAYSHFDNIYDDDKNVHEGDWRGRVSLYVQIDDANRIASVDKQLHGYRENNNRVRDDFQISSYVLDPLVGMARRDQANDTWRMTRSSPAPASVISPIIMSVLLLLIACFNMTNTSIAISARRLKEIGIRKVMGGVRTQLIVQFIGETFVVCTVALVVGLFFGELLLAAWNALWVAKMESHYLDAPAVISFLAVVLVATALLAGSYPALYISRFEPVSILKGKARFGGTNHFTRALLVLQYAISLVAVVFAIAFYQNALFQRDFHLGFDDKNIIIAYVNSESEFETYRNVLSADKDITAIAGSTHSIFSVRYRHPIKYESREIEVDIIDVGEDYLRTMGLELVEGRDFQRDSETDRRESVIVTEGLAKSLGWQNALGKQITWKDTAKLYVVGVIKDVYTEGLWEAKEPMMIRNVGPEYYTHVIVRAPIQKLRIVNQRMEAAWKQVFPTRLYNGRYLDEIMMEAVVINTNIVKIFGFLGIVALLLSATGLYTLVSLNIIKRMKEIGVRKVLGATVSNITRVINTEFVIMLMLSSLMGCVMAYYAVDMLMAMIWDTYRAASLLTLGVSVAVLFAVSAAVVGYKVFMAATMNPVTTLRAE